MATIKQRRLRECRLASHPDLFVGQCVPFYFCPRSVMLYVIHCGNNPGLDYSGGQEPIVHLVADLKTVVRWAEREGRRWAFTLSNAGTRYFEDYCDLGQLHRLNWEAIQARDWRDPERKEGKQAEFLIERSFPWTLVEHIGVFTRRVYDKVHEALAGASHRPQVAIRWDWYY